MFRVIQAATCAVALMLAVPVEAQHAQGGADKHGAKAEKATYPSITADVDIENNFFPRRVREHTFRLSKPSKPGNPLRDKKKADEKARKEAEKKAKNDQEKKPAPKKK